MSYTKPQVIARNSEMGQMTHCCWSTVIGAPPQYKR